MCLLTVVTECFGNLQGTASTNIQNIGNVADPFFLSQFVVFDIADKTVSFAPFA